MYSRTHDIHLTTHSLSQALHLASACSFHRKQDIRIASICLIHLLSQSCPVPNRVGYGNREHRHLSCSVIHETSTLGWSQGFSSFSSFSYSSLSICICISISLSFSLLALSLRYACFCLFVCVCVYVCVCVCANSHNATYTIADHVHVLALW